MARPLRIEFQDACYLVTLQGADGIGLFDETRDARHFEQLMALSADKHRATLHAYALAQNSAMLLVQTPEGNLGMYLQGILTAFARHIRHHYVQSGPIMQGRYRAQLVEPGKPLRAAAEWVHGLPVRDRDTLRTPAQKEKFLAKYAHSSFLTFIEGKEDQLADPTQVLRSYGSPVAKRGSRHADAVTKAVLSGADEKEVLGTFTRLAIGSEEFQKTVLDQHEKLRVGKKVKGVKTYGKKAKGVARNRLVNATATAFSVDKSEFFRHRHDSMLRPALAFTLYQFGAMTQQEIADFIGVGSAAAVSLQIKRLLKRRSDDQDLDKRLTTIESEFSTKA